MQVTQVSYKKTISPEKFKPEQFETTIAVEEGEDVALALQVVKAVVRAGLLVPAPGDADLIEASGI